MSELLLTAWCVVALILGCSSLALALHNRRILRQQRPNRRLSSISDATLHAVDPAKITLVVIRLPEGAGPSDVRYAADMVVYLQANGIDAGIVMLHNWGVTFAEQEAQEAQETQEAIDTPA